LVATYISGLGGIVGQQVRFRMPSSLDEAVQVAITVNNAEGTKQTDTKKSVQCEAGWRSPGICVFQCFNCGKRGHCARDCRFRGRTIPLRVMVAPNR